VRYCHVRDSRFSLGTAREFRSGSLAPHEGDPTQLCVRMDHASEIKSESAQ
jgi:hypothetical protein